MRTRYVVQLDETERATLLEVIHKGKHAARKIRRAQTLLMAAAGGADSAIAHALNIGLSTVERTRKRLVEEGLEAALSERPRSGGPKKLDARAEALIIATACSSPPEGHSRWSVRLLAEKAVALEVAESLSHETVRSLLKKTISSRGEESSGASPQ